MIVLRATSVNGVETQGEPDWVHRMCENDAHQMWPGIFGALIGERAGHGVEAGALRTALGQGVRGA